MARKESAIKFSLRSASLRMLTPNAFVVARRAVSTLPIVGCGIITLPGNKQSVGNAANMRFHSAIYAFVVV